MSKMNNQEKYKIAFRMTSRASTGLSFIEDYLMHNFITDAAYLRSFYVLLSYNAELILKSRVVMMGNFVDKDGIDKKLKSLSHDISKTSKELGYNELMKLGIKEITKKDNQYKIVTIDGKETVIEDFTDIRYDFLDGKIRIIDTKEHERVKEYIETIFSILKNTKKENNSNRLIQTVKVK